MGAQTDDPPSCSEDHRAAPNLTRYPRTPMRSGAEGVGVVAVAMAVTMAAGANSFYIPPEGKRQRKARMAKEAAEKPKPIN